MRLKHRPHRQRQRAREPQCTVWSLEIRLRRLLMNPRRSDNDAFLLGFCKAVYRNDIEAALEHMRTYLATIPYDLENHSEKHYQTIFYLMFSFLNIYIRTEVKSAIGRADAVMHMPDTIDRKSVV